VIPARPRKPRDKAKVEVGVQIVQRWIVAALRHRKFFSLAEVNEAIGVLLERLNQRPFRKREGCRASLFAALDRPALGALPAERYEFGSWKTVTVNLDYHVEVEHSFYSVPYQLAGNAVEVRVTATTVEILHQGLRVASHARSFETQKATTVNEHRPKSHQRHLEWNHSRIVEWAAQTGPFTTQLVETILAAQRHPEQGFRSCLGIIGLSKKYPLDRMEAAAQRALRLRACSYRSLRSILEKQLDRLPLNDSVPAPSAPQHPNIRGAAYFDDVPPTIH
jgi:transposase